MKQLYFVVSVLSVASILSGCAHKDKNIQVKEKQKDPIEIPVNKNNVISSSLEVDRRHVEDNLLQCRQELAALKRFDHASWLRSRVEFEKITKSSAAYMEVVDTISDDINNMVRPKYQYILRSFCWRVRNNLVYTLSHQVNIND